MDTIRHRVAALLAAFVLLAGGLAGAEGLASAGAATPTRVGTLLPGSTNTSPTPTTGTSPTPPTGLNVLIMGSSTTGCTGPSAPAKCYVNLIKAERPADTVTVIGRGGTYVAYGPPAGNWTQTTIPGGNDVVVIQLGINDWYVPIDPAVYRAQLDGVIDGQLGLLTRVRAANPTARILWLATWMPAYGVYAEARQRMWQDHGVVLAAAMAAVGGELIDMDPTGDARVAAPRRADPTSGWHYNDRGHRELADAVEAALART